MGYLERMWRFTKLALGALNGLELERTAPGDCMNWKSFGSSSVTHKPLKKENCSLYGTFKGVCEGSIPLQSRAHITQEGHFWLRV